MSLDAARATEFGNVKSGLAAMISGTLFLVGGGVIFFTWYHHERPIRPPSVNLRPRRGATPTNGLVELLRTRDPVELDAVRNYLEGHDIAVSVFDYYSSSLLRFMPDQQVRVFVGADDFEDAVHLLDERKASDGAA